MPLGASRSADIKKTRIVLGLLESVERGGEQPPRDLAAKLGGALGLVNAYLKRCISKGLVKVRTTPARRYAILGANELAEIATICSLDLGVTVAAVADAKSELTRFVGVPVLKSFDVLEKSIDALPVVDLTVTPGMIETAADRFGAKGALVPEFVGTSDTERLGDQA